MHAEYIKLCGHESARRHQNLERPLRELSVRRCWIGITARLPCGPPKITPHGAPENVGENVHAIEKSQQAPDTEATGNEIAESEDTLPDN